MLFKKGNIAKAKVIAADNGNAVSLPQFIAGRASAYFRLLKFRLSTLVVISAVFGFMMAPGAVFSMEILFLIAGGFLVTGASNGLNQVLESEFDKLMTRTKNRPLPMSEITHTEGLIFSLVCGISGVLILGIMFNLTAALLGIIALLSYAFVYTPLKRKSRIAVLIGAIPGAMPPLIGWAAVTGEIGMIAWILFLFQFLWQFPHFWAIAWIMDEDYNKAGFKMLPSKTGKSSFTATIILIYTVLLIPACFLLWKMEIAGGFSLLTVLMSGVLFTWFAWVLLQKQDDKAAKKLMYFSFIYLPVIQVALLLN